MVAAPCRDRGQRQGTSMAPPWSPFTRCAVVCRVLMPEKTSRCVRGVFSRVRATVRVLRSASSSLSRALHVGMSLVGYATPSPMLILWPDSSIYSPQRGLGTEAANCSPRAQEDCAPTRHTSHSLSSLGQNERGAPQGAGGPKATRRTAIRFARSGSPGRPQRHAHIVRPCTAWPRLPLLRPAPLHAPHSRRSHRPLACEDGSSVGRLTPSLTRAP